MRALREWYGARLPLVLMNSAATRGPSLDALHRYGGLPVPGVPLDFLQGREAKVRADDWQGARRASHGVQRSDRSPEYSLQRALRSVLPSADVSRSSR